MRKQTWNALPTMSAVDVPACSTPSTMSANAGQRVNVTSGCAPSLAAVLPLPRDTPPEPDGPNGPNKAGNDNDQRG